MGRRQGSKELFDGMEQARAALALERDRAIERFNSLREQVGQMVRQHNQMQQDMVRWVIAFMLQQNQHAMTLKPGFLKQTDNWVLQRANDPADDTITWRIVTREEFLRQQEAEKSAEQPAPPEE